MTQVSIRLFKVEGFDDDGNEIKIFTTYYAPPIKGRYIRQVIQLGETINEKAPSTADLDMMVDVVVKIFGGKITADDIWDGTLVEEILDVLFKVINTVKDNTLNKLGQIPNE